MKSTQLFFVFDHKAGLYSCEKLGWSKWQLGEIEYGPGGVWLKMHMGEMTVSLGVGS